MLSELTTNDCRNSTKPKVSINENIVLPDLRIYFAPEERFGAFLLHRFKHYAA